MRSKRTDGLGHRFDYQRTDTDATIRVTFSNGDVFDVPARIVAESRDAHYADEEEDTIGLIREGSLDDYDLIDWLSSNMNWSDVAPFAVKVEMPPKPIDYETEWSNAKKKVVGNI